MGRGHQLRPFESVSCPIGSSTSKHSASSKLHDIGNSSAKPSSSLQTTSTVCRTPFSVPSTILTLTVISQSHSPVKPHPPQHSRRTSDSHSRLLSGPAVTFGKQSSRSNRFGALRFGCQRQSDEMAI